MKEIILIPMLFLLTGCGGMFPIINTPKPPDLKYQIHEVIKQNPAYSIDPAGGVTQVFNATEHTYDVNVERADKPLSAWQKFCNWLSGLSLLGLIALIAGFVIAPAGTMTWVLARYFAFKKALKQTVKAIDEAKAVEKYSEIKDALSANHDNDTKKLIDDIKRA